MNLRPPRRVGQIAIAGLACFVGATIAVGGVRAPMQGANLVPHGQEPADDAGWEREASILFARYPEDPRVRYGLALQEAAAGAGEKASADLEAAIAEQRKMSPVHAGTFRFGAHAAVGANFFNAGDLEDAIAQYSAALRSDPRPNSIGSVALRSFIAGGAPKPFRTFVRR